MVKNTGTVVCKNVCTFALLHHTATGGAANNFTSSHSNVDGSETKRKKIQNTFLHYPTLHFLFFNVACYKLIYSSPACNEEKCNLLFKKSFRLTNSCNAAHF